jgi:hypothetical protein
MDFCQGKSAGKSGPYCQEFDTPLISSYVYMGLKVVGELRFARSPGCGFTAIGLKRPLAALYTVPFLLSKAPQPDWRASAMPIYNPVGPAQRCPTHNPYEPFIRFSQT